MMNKRILTIVLPWRWSAGTSLALARDIRSPVRLFDGATAYPPGGYPADYRRGPGAPGFRPLDE